MEEKKTWAVGAGSGIGWLKALLVSYLISVLLLLLLSFLLWCYPVFFFSQKLFRSADQCSNQPNRMRQPMRVTE